MSQQLINRSPDLLRLRNEGYNIEIRAGHLLVRDIPYVNSKREIKFGVLVTELKLAGDVTTIPDNHVAMFSGEHPCHKDGSEITRIKHTSDRKQIDSDFAVDHSFSSKPSGGYKDYYEKMITYIAIISSPAQSIDPNVTAQTFPVFASAVEDDSVFNYVDTASSRAGISVISKKLELARVGIVGMGGTGSYVLDFVAKTPVREIHIFDGDKFSQHNAFRSPGAPSVEDLGKHPSKVEYFREQYSRMHKFIVPNEGYITASNVDQLAGMDFVFLCLDTGSSRKLLLEKLEAFSVPFIDVGMGVQQENGALGGILRITASTMLSREKARKRIPVSEGDYDNVYSQNIQVADLNAITAALAVIKWKKLFGFYRDLENELNCTYTIDGNRIDNEDQP